jgi:type IV pilus assembly protein PilB
MKERAIELTNHAPIAKVEAPTPGHRKRSIGLGALLVGSGLITPAQLALATTHTERPGGQLPQVLVRFGIVSQDDLASLLAEEYRLAAIDLTSIDPTSAVLRLVPHALARRHVILPIDLAGSTLSVAIADPTNLVGLSEVKLRSGYGLNVALAPAESLATAIERFYSARTRAAG